MYVFIRKYSWQLVFTAVLAYTGAIHIQIQTIIVVFFCNEQDDEKFSLSLFANGNLEKKFTT